MLALDVLGIKIPDSRPLFIAALAIHVPAGITSVIAGILTTTARKQPGRHPKAGRVYLAGLALICMTAAVMAPMRWSHNRLLFVLDFVAFALAGIGLLARRRTPPRWKVWHGTGMAGSYIVLLVAFYLDNGPNLPLWNRLPHLFYWLLPVAIGVPLTVLALIRNRAWKDGAPWPTTPRSTSTTTRPLR